MSGICATSERSPDMCKQHYEEVLGRIAIVGSNAPDCVEVVALVLDRECDKVQTIIANVDIDATIDRFERALVAAKEVKRQMAVGLAHIGDTPPTAH